MAAKKKKTKEEPKETKKRIKPVVEVVEEPTTEETPIEQPTESTEAESTSVEESDTQVDAPVLETVEETETESEPATDLSETEVAAPEVPNPMQNEDSNAQPEEKSGNEHKMSIKTILIIAIISALVAAFVSGGVYVYLNGISDLQSTINTEENEAETTEEVEATTSPTPEPTEAPTVSEDLTVYKIEVLNGSGEIGAAGAASDVIEDGGFVVEDTGNADNYDYTATVVQYKEGTIQADIDALVTALEKSYEVELNDEPLSASSDYDFVVTVGSN